MTLTGKDALELHERIKHENLSKQAERLARAKEEAAARGKEPLDLAKLETMCAIEALGRMTPEERVARLEKMYYVEHPELVTLAELARLVDELGRW
jgi:hypothetical protein